MGKDGALDTSVEYLSTDHHGGKNRCLWMMDAAVGKACSTNDRRIKYGGQAILYSPGNDCYLTVDTEQTEGMPGWHRGVASEARIEHSALEFSSVEFKVDVSARSVAFIADYPA